MTDVPEVVAFRAIHPAEEALGRIEEFSTPEAVVAALYDVLSGPPEEERERDWTRFRALTLPSARFLLCRWPDAEGQPRPDLREWDIEGFITDAKSAYRTAGFWEQEVRGRTEHFGSVAHRFSSYESRVGSEESEPVGRGINSVQLVRFGKRWWIANVVWDVEGPEQPIPARYL